MKIKELQKTVNIAWSPKQQCPIYMAAGTAAQQFDSSANSTLEIYSTNFSDPSYDLELKASIPSQYRFHKLIWSPIVSDGAHQNGFIVGGCEAGQIMVYSAAKMLANENALVARQDKHTGAVSGLDFNPFQNNLLASCASESEIYIWDLNNPTTHMNPGQKTQPFEDVKNVAWNRQVQHILASVFSTRCVIWDLRKSQQIIKLSDSQSHVRWHSIQWHPDVATQVWLASEDDQAPVFQLWDLRYATAPAKTYQIHQRGVLGMSWCPSDTDLMVSCGKDNRIYCWNPNTEINEGEILSEVATTTTWYSDVQWCPRNPALIASSSFDGNVSIYSLFGGTQQVVQTSNKIADSFPGMDQFAQAPIPQQATQITYHDLKNAPKWLKRPCGVAFGFGGKLISFNSKSKIVNISQVTTEPDLVQRANDLEQTLTGAKYVDYCRQRADQMTDQNGRYLWYFVKAHFELNPKEEMLNLLGYNKDDSDNKFAKYAKEENDIDTQQKVDELTNRISTLTHQTIDNAAIFDGIADAAQKPEVKKTKSQFKIPNGDDNDSLITEALLTGNIEAAVELCLEANCTSEALIIASTNGIEYLTKIQNRYLSQQQNELSNVISALVTRDWLDFVNRCTLDSWKEALVAVLKHSERKVVDICEELGDRLLNEGANSVEYARNAILCYVCAGSIECVVAAWYRLKQIETQNPQYKLNTNELQELAEVVMLIAKSLEQQGIALNLHGSLATFITEYGTLLASEGALTAALAYIYALGTCDHDKLDQLKQRLYNTVNYKPAIRRPYQQQTQQQSIHQQQQQSAAAENIYGRHQQQRGSFSQMTQSLAPPILNAQQQAPQQHQYTNAVNNHNWQGSNVAAVPPSIMPNLNSSSVASAPPNIYNQFQTAKPLQPEPPFAQQKPLQPQITQQPQSQPPPRPPSNASSHGGSVNATSTNLGSLHSRSKYVLDPSVAPTNPTIGGYGNTYNPATVPFQSVPQPTPLATTAPYNNSAFNMNPLGGSAILQPQATLLQPAPMQQQQQYNNAYLPGVAPIEAAVPPMARPPAPIQNVARKPTPPPGWNDPPALKSTRSLKNPDTITAPTAPITHPLFGGIDPNQNGFVDPNQYQQQQNAVGGPPQPPTSTASAVNAYYNSNANNSLQQQHSHQQQQHQQAVPGNQWNTQLVTQKQQQPVGYTEQPAAVQNQSNDDAPKELIKLPEEYAYLQTVLEELKSQCLNATDSPRIKRKFADITKRLENLYYCLRDGRLTPPTLRNLNQIVQCIQIGDYTNALKMHTSIAFGSDFSQCAAFMPGLKMLLHSATELRIVLR